MRGRAATVVDLFSGAGGFSLGFHAAGARLLAAADASECAGATLRANFEVLQPDAPPVVLAGDEGDLDGLDLGRLAKRRTGPDILVGGPPCQGFSRIGRAKLASLAEDPGAGDPRNELYRRFLDAALFWRPLAVVMENVPGMASIGGVDVADLVAGELAACGYRVGHVVLNAVWYGVPQFRERIFFVGTRSDLGIEPSVPRPTNHLAVPVGYQRPRHGVTIPFAFVPHYELPVPMAAASRPATTVQDALDDLPPIREHLEETARSRPADFRVRREYGRAPGSEYARLMRSWPGLPSPTGIDDHVIRRTPRDYETFRRMKADDRYPEALAIAELRYEETLAALREKGTCPSPGSLELDELRRGIVPPYPADRFRDKWRKLDARMPSWTVPAHLSRDAYSHIHHDSSQARAISVREAARLQSFPDSFSFRGNMGDSFTQIGNAVPPLLAWAIAAHLLDLLGFVSRPAPWSLHVARQRRSPGRREVQSRGSSRRTTSPTIE